MEAIIKALAQELGQKEVYVENVVRLIDEGAATARSCTGPWTTSCCASWRTGCNICGT